MPILDEEGLQLPSMVEIPKGAFMMGARGAHMTDAEIGAAMSESPPHLVTIACAFEVARNPVTFAEFDAFCLAEGIDKPHDEDWGRSDRPVINVSWNDAQAYIAWLNRKTGLKYRLLSEAEWEYAARAHSTTPFSFGDMITSEDANYFSEISYNDGPSSEGREQTTPVGSFSPNDFGLYDMHGNVWEWTQDCWHDFYKGAPTDGSPWLSDNEEERVIRGGSWSMGPYAVRSASRSRWQVTGGKSDLGFRLARCI